MNSLVELIDLYEPIIGTVMLMFIESCGYRAIFFRLRYRDVKNGNV